jgi:hypothetical protein
MQMQAAVLKDQDLKKIEELLKQGVDINAPIGCGTYARWMAPSRPGT